MNATRKVYMDFVQMLTRAAIRLITNGTTDPSALEIAREFYGREPVKGEIQSVSDALRDVIDFAVEGCNGDGKPVWGLDRRMLTPLCEQYYTGVYVPYRTAKNKVRRRKIVPRLALRKPAELSFLTENMEQDIGTISCPIGGGKTYAGLYYSENPLDDPIPLRWLTFMAACVEGGRIQTQKLIRESGGSLETERLIFQNADKELQAKGREAIAPPLRQESLEEAQPVLQLKHD